MTSDNKSYIATNEVILSAKEAANLLQCTPDYITKLAREGKLDGTQNGKGWQVTHSSLKRYEATRDNQKAERAKDLAEERRRELVASTPTSLKHVYVALMLSLVFGATTFSLASVIKHDVAGIQAASLGRVESPFFASFDLGGVVGSVRDAVARLFAPSTNLSPVANQNISTPNTATTTIVNNYTTAQVVERIVERVAPADSATLTVNFSDWATAFETRFELQVNRIFDVIGDLETGGGGISTITDADVPDTITASNYLPLAGGTLTGDLFGTTATFDSILVTDATSTNATTTNFWLLGAAEGCAQFDTNGKLTSTGTNCGSGGGGADGNWVYFNGSGIRLATTSVQVVIGATATSSDSKVQIVGGLTLDNSTTTSATTTTFGITALQNALLGTNAEGSVIATTSLSISQYLTGTLPVANGGTGASSLTSGQLLYGAGTGAVQSVATGTVSSGAGISVTAGQYIIGSGLTITNTGVTSLAGTANQITASAATG
ncbi:helix-turn-helix domain-containing protein, partial [Candidatus Nomurabacteria bacterium]|nr:helix-turn-helix domain-containing protein [Candidatus Nomurabacteria bacterium]